MAGRALRPHHFRASPRIAVRNGFLHDAHTRPTRGKIKQGRWQPTCAAALPAPAFRGDDGLLRPSAVKPPIETPGRRINDFDHAAGSAEKCSPALPPAGVRNGQRARLVHAVKLHVQRPPSARRCDPEFNRVGAVAGHNHGVRQPFPRSKPADVEPAIRVSAGFEIDPGLTYQCSSRRRIKSRRH